MAIRAVLSGTVFGLAAAGLLTTAALARQPTYRSYYGMTSPDVSERTPFGSGAAGIPGQQHACVKTCSRDSSPCDPPIYKQADGRCNYAD